MNKYTFALVLVLIGCNANNKKDTIVLTNDSLQLISTQWKTDSLGCDRLRDPKKIRQLIDQLELVGKDSSVIIDYLGVPNGRNHIGTDTTVFIYYMACGMNHGTGFNFYCSFAEDKMYAIHTLILN